MNRIPLSHLMPVPRIHSIDPLFPVRIDRIDRTDLKKDMVLKVEVGNMVVDPVEKVIYPTIGDFQTIEEISVDPVRMVRLSKGRVIQGTPKVKVKAQFKDKPKVEVRIGKDRDRLEGDSRIVRPLSTAKMRTDGGNIQIEEMGSMTYTKTGTGTRLIGIEAKGTGTGV